MRSTTDRVADRDHTTEQPVRTSHDGTHRLTRRTRRGSPALTLLAALTGVMMVGLDGTIVAVANPAIQSHLHASLSDIQWVTNAYLLGIAVSLITMGKLGDRFGHKTVFLTGVFGFAATSAVIGLSGQIAASIGLVIAFRAVQGVFGGMLLPNALALLRETFTRERLGAAIGAWGAVMGASTAAGPVVGGLLVQHINWESCFYVNIPVGVVSLTIGLLVLRKSPPSPAATSFDIPGIATLSGALFLLVWAVVKASDYGWGSARSLGFLTGSAALAGLFVWRQARARQPLLPLRLFRSVSLSVGTVLLILLIFAMYGAMFFMTFYLQNVHGLDPVATGVHLLPITLTVMVVALLASIAIRRIGPRYPMATGLLLAAVALYGLSRLTPDSGVNDTIVWFLLFGLGLAPVMVGASNVIVGNAPVELAGVAGGLQSTAYQIGGALGTSVLGAVLTSRINTLLPTNWQQAHLPALNTTQYAVVKSAVSVGIAPVPPGTPPRAATAITTVSHATFIAGMHTTFLVAAAVALAGAVLALAIRRGPVPTTARSPNHKPARRTTNRRAQCPVQYLDRGEEVACCGCRGGLSFGGQVRTSMMACAPALVHRPGDPDQLHLLSPAFTHSWLRAGRGRPVAARRGRCPVRDVARRTGRTPAASRYGLRRTGRARRTTRPHGRGCWLLRGRRRVPGTAAARRCSARRRRRVVR
jgi:EmrB/QacA subfamily drug resistance transporter